MKKTYLLLIFVLGFSAFGQQKGISYQAVIINPNEIVAPGFNGTSIPLANKSICLSFQIVNEANQVEYQESQSITTDVYGMVNVVIGTGIPGAGVVTTLEAVAWNQGNKKLIVAVNTEGICSNYIEISNQVLNYTPYSFYAQNADLKDGYVTTAKLADGAVTDAKVALGINPAKVGLSNVDNTSDANKPVSTATQMALDLKVNTSDATTSLALKEDVANKSSVTSLGNSDQLYPTQNAVKTYVDTQMTSATIADANATTRGKIQLAGDLGGTATAPTVPGLALKANVTDVTSALALKANTSSLSTIATSGDYNDLSNKPTIPSSYTLPTASASVLGGVKIGANLSVDVNGILSASSSNNISFSTGILPIVNGGTGATTATDAFNLLAPSQASNSGKYLTTDGTNTSWANVGSALATRVDTGGPYDIAMVTAGGNGNIVVGIGNGGTAATLNPHTGQMDIAGLTVQGYGITTGGNLNVTGLTPSKTVFTDASKNLTTSGLVDIANGGTGASTKTTAFEALSPMITSGDIIYGGASGTGTRLPKGNDGEFLKLSSGVPSWGSPFAGMSSLNFSGTNNRLNVYGNSFEMFGTDSILLNPGTDGQVYIDTYSNGARVATRDYADTKAPLYANINNKSASYILTASDNGKVLTFDDASSMTLTVPTGLAAGFNCMIVQKGIGLVTIVPVDNTVTVTNRSGGTKTAGQNAIVTLIALSGTYFIMGGDMQ